MAFIKEYRSTRDEFPEWEYLNSIGVRNFLGKPIKNWTTKLVVDRENNYYLIPLGHTNPNRDNEYIGFYALCLDGKVINMEVKRQQEGKSIDNTIECYWTIKKIKFPKNWKFDVISQDDLKKIINDAFVNETYSKTVTVENVRKITVDIFASAI